MNQYIRIPIITTLLIVINIIIFAAFIFMPNLMPLYNQGVLSTEALQQGHYWTLITSMFLHGSILHIICNMISLYYLGIFSETVFGKIRFLIIYFISGIAGGILYCIVGVLTENVVGAVGASGAIFGLFGAYGYILFRESKNNEVLAVKPTKNDITSFLTLLAINIIYGISNPGIANEAHIGGLISGFILAAAIYPLIVRRG